MDAVSVAYTIWVALVLALLCVRVWVCIIRAVIRYERDREAADIDSDHIE